MNARTIVKNKKLSIISVFIFGIFTLAWIYLRFTVEATQSQLDILGGTYGLMALYGGIVGLKVSSKWGGRKSLIGCAIMLIALGLLAQEFGQIVYTYLGITTGDIPYPSIGDIGYFGSVLLYIAGVAVLAKATGFHINIRSLSNKLQAVVIPVALLLVSYTAFLRGYEFDWANPLVVLLDFGYPLGQAVYISIAILVFLLSRKLLGGIMRPVVLFLLGALCVQYFADYTFLYKNANETWEVAGMNDYMYLVAYFVMTTALLRFNTVVNKLNDSPVPVVSSTNSQDGVVSSKNPEDNNG